MGKVTNGYVSEDPKLMPWWNVERNSEIDPSKIGRKSGRYFWWKCPDCGHEFQQTPAHFGRFYVCPRCHREKIADDPEMMKWFSKDNPKGLEFRVCKHQHVMVKWICPECGETFERVTYNWHKSHLCRSCAVKKRNAKPYVVKKSQHLLKDVPELFRWYDVENNNELLDHLCVGAHKVLNWRCPECGYQFSRNARSMTFGPSCSHCGHAEKGIPPFNLQAPSLVETNPELLEYWDYERNGDLTPDKLSAKSACKVYFKCSKCGEPYLANPGTRLNTMMACPDCACGFSTSFPEQAIYFYLSQIVPCESRRKIDGVEFDLYIPSLSVVVEYDGVYFHRKNRRKHLIGRKEEVCKVNNLKLVRVIEGKRNYIGLNLVHLDCRNIDYDWMIYALEVVVGLPYHAVDVDINRDSPLILSQYKHFEERESLAVKQPFIAAEWNYEKNGSLLPTQVKSKSAMVVWWKCSECGHEWSNTIAHRTNYAKYRKRKNANCYTKCPSCGHRTKRIVTT